MVNTYSQSQISDLKSKIMQKINTEITLALKNCTLDEIIRKIWS